MNGKSIVGRHQRLIDILEQLRAGCPLDAGQLARQCRVSKRTVFRDIDLLRSAGMPIRFDKATCCYRLDEPEGTVELPAFEPSELSMLIVAIHFSSLQYFSGFHNQLQRAVMKLLAACSFQLRQSVNRLTAACTVGRLEGCNTETLERTIATVFQAIRQRRLLQTTIAERCDTLVETELAPYEIIATPTMWRIVGRSTYHHAVRTIDARHILHAELSDRAFAMPRKYDRAS